MLPFGSFHTRLGERVFCSFFEFPKRGFLKKATHVLVIGNCYIYIHLCVITIVVSMHKGVEFKIAFTTGYRFHLILCVSFLMERWTKYGLQNLFVIANLNPKFANTFWNQFAFMKTHF